MKNAKREVIERCVSLNRGELLSLRQLVGRAADEMRDGCAYDCRPLLYRIREKLDRAIDWRRR